MNINFSLLLNILILVPVCSCLLLQGGADWVQVYYGPASPARGILLSVYISILGTSLWLLLVKKDPHMVAALLIVQIAYKLTTPLTVGTLSNPVVMCNLGVAAFHSVTVAAILNGSERTKGR